MGVPKPTWKVFFAGVLGGAIDAAPSISGATVYYVVGIYANILESITKVWDSLSEAVYTRSFRPIFDEMAWRYLIVLKGGVVLSFLFFAHAILLALQNPSTRPLLFSIFSGFVLGSAVLCFNKILSWKKISILLFAFGLFLGLLVTFAPPIFSEPLYSVPVISPLPAAENVDVTHRRLLHVPFSAIVAIKDQGQLDVSASILDETTQFPLEVSAEIFSKTLMIRPGMIMTGIVVATAMLLPGISGSYVLNVLGYYSTVLSAILEVLSHVWYLEFPLNAWELLFNLGAGVLLGVIVLSRIVLLLFRKHPCVTQAFIAGGMFGSLSCLWPFQKLVSVVDPFHLMQGTMVVNTGRYLPSFYEAFTSWPLFVGAGAAFTAVFLLQYISSEKTADTVLI